MHVPKLGYYRVSGYTQEGLEILGIVATTPETAGMQARLIRDGLEVDSITLEGRVDSMTASALEGA